METRAGEDLGQLHLPQCWTEDSETLHEIGYEIGKLVRRLGQADERIRPFFVETPHPGGDSERAYQEDAGGLSEGPATGGSEFENRKPRGRRLIGPPVGLDISHPGVLDSDLSGQELNLLTQPVLFCLLSELRVHAFRSPALRQCQRSPGKGDNLYNRRPDSARPASG